MHSRAHTSGTHTALELAANAGQRRQAGVGTGLDSNELLTPRRQGYAPGTPQHTELLGHG